MPDNAPELTESATVMFADISGSTGMYAIRGDVAAYRLTSRCMLLLEDQVRRTQGRIIKHIGDEILAAFDSAESAVRAAAGIQQALEDPVCELRREGIHIRCGIASGTVVVDHEDVFGDVVNVAARLVSLAGADEILLSETTGRSLPDPMRDCLRLIDMLALRGRPDTIAVYEYLWHWDAERATIVNNDRTRKFSAMLELRYGAHVFVISAERPKITIGRDADNDIDIPEEVVSRHHADVVLRGDRFLLVDRSTNGTYVLTDGGDKVRVNRDETTLTGAGRILPGSKHLDAVRYRALGR